MQCLAPTDPTPTPKTQGTSQKRGQKDSKNQRN